MHFLRFELTSADGRGGEVRCRGIARYRPSAVPPRRRTAAGSGPGLARRAIFPERAGTGIASVNRARVRTVRRACRRAEALLESARLFRREHADRPSMSQTYTAQDIEVLSGLEPVRRRPGMYTDTSRPNHLAHEVIDNSVDEALVGSLQPHRRHRLQGRLGRGERRRSRHAGRRPSEGEGERRRADPDAPARGREVHRGDLQVLRRPARRRRVGGERAVEASRVLGAPRRQGIQHLVPQREGPLEARGGGRGRQEQHRDHGAVLARSGVLRQPRDLAAEAEARAQGQGGALPRPQGPPHGREGRREGGVAVHGRARAVPARVAGLG